MNMSKFLQAADPIYKNPIIAFPLTATDRLVFQSNIAKLYEIPSNTELILITSTKAVYVLFGNDSVFAELPDEYDVLDGSAAMLNPGLICGISFTGYTHISLISASSGELTIQRWARR
jgi:hypothetical protein